MVLVDTTVWIDLLRGLESPATARLRELLDKDQATVVPLIVQEVLPDRAHLRWGSGAPGPAAHSD